MLENTRRCISEACFHRVADNARLELDNLEANIQKRIAAACAEVLRAAAESQMEALAKEKERVIAGIYSCQGEQIHKDAIKDYLYPPKKLPAGAYWIKSSHALSASNWDRSFKPCDDYEYIPIPSMEECRRIAEGKE